MRDERDETTAGPDGFIEAFTRHQLLREAVASVRMSRDPRAQTISLDDWTVDGEDER